MDEITSTAEEISTTEERLLFQITSVAEVAEAVEGLEIGWASGAVAEEAVEAIEDLAFNITLSEIQLTSIVEAMEAVDAVLDAAIEGTSAAEGPEVGGTSSAAERETKVGRYWKYDSTSSSESIFRAPAHMRYGRESDFEPKLVSIGPYHRARQNLQPMEKTKIWCMSNLLMMRPGDENKGEDNDLFYNRGEIIMDHVPVDPFMKFESRARSYYKEKFDQIRDVEFVQMLLLDSCFLIRILLSLRGGIPESMGSVEVNIKEVRSDLLLLENQIPLFFLNVVYIWLFPNAHINLISVLRSLIIRDLPWQFSYNCLYFESDHLLDFYWKSSVPNTEQLIEIMKRGKLRQTPRWADIPRSLPKLIANATELHQIAGVKFESNYYPDGVQVEFSKGIMRMRCLKIESSLATSLVNLIAFENSMPSSLRIISTYIKLLDDLINSEKDVELLQKFGVIFNTLTSHTMAATFFNDIGNLCLIDKYNNHLSDLFANVEEYYKSSWNRRWASLQNNYFNSPWAGISVFAGVILLILTVVATFYTIYAYYNPRN